MDQKRLDVLLVERGIASSRENAKRMIEAGNVKVNGTDVKKPSKTFNVDSEIYAKTEKYVGRGAYKLEKAIDLFDIDVDGKHFMDCGASTGGFTDCLLCHGAQHVWAVDVGSMQLADKLKNDTRVTSIENTNIRYIEQLDWMNNIDGVVIDVSFISLTLILKRLFEVIPRTAFYVALIKPQFEAGREALNKHGIVKDSKAHVAVLKKITDFVSENGYAINGLTSSPIKGGDGNSEYLIYFSSKQSGTAFYTDTAIDIAVKEALAAD